MSDTRYTDAEVEDFVLSHHIEVYREDGSTFCTDCYVAGPCGTRRVVESLLAERRALLFQDNKKTKQANRVRRGKKACWLSRETPDGWTLALCVGNKYEYPLAGALFLDADAAKHATDGRLSVVFVHMEEHS